MSMLHIVYNSDNGYVMPTMVSAASALAWASRRSEVCLHVLDTGIDDQEWSRIESTLRTRFGSEFGLQRHQIDCGRFAGLRKWRGVSYATYARVLDAEILNDISWCLHCDGDTLFTDDPLKICPEYSPNFAMQGHVDWQKMGVVSAQEAWFKKNGLGWDPKQYVCCGFMLVNLDWFRVNNIADKCLDLLRKYPDAPFVDQEPLNYFCRGKIGYLPNRWGMFTWDAFRTERTGCLHYASDVPWKLMTNRYRDYNDAHRLWFKYAKTTLGLEMNDVIVGGMKRSVMIRKLLWRIIFVSLAKCVRTFKFLQETGIGNYCLRHYASRRQWREIDLGETAQ